MIDPGIKIFLQETAHTEEVLSRLASEGNVQNGTEVFLKLDQKYSNLGIQGRVVSVTGKLRVVRDGEGTALMEYLTADEDVLAHILEKLGEP